MTLLKNVDSVFAFFAIVSLSLRYYRKGLNSEAKGMTSAFLGVVGAISWLIFVRSTSGIYIGLINNAITLGLFFCSVMVWQVWLHDLGISLRAGSGTLTKANGRLGSGTRTESLKIRVTPEEKTEQRASAGRAGLAATTWAQMLVLLSAKKYSSGR
jgi:hypothetical protein